MNTYVPKSLMALSVFLCGLTACGGGGADASGAPGALSLTPEAFLCDPSSTGTATVLINGGAGSYSVATTAPSGISIGPVSRVNGVYQFSFTILGSACLADPGVSIQVTDVRKNFAVAKISKAASGA